MGMPDAKTFFPMKGRPHMVDRSVGRSSTPVLEAVILLVFLMVSIAVCVELFGISAVQSSEAKRLNAATLLASDVAERFSADPESIPAVVDGRVVLADEGRGLVAHNSVSSSFTGAGVLYTIDISITDDGSSEVFSLSSSKYMSGGSY